MTLTGSNRIGATRPIPPPPGLNGRRPGPEGSSGPVQRLKSAGNHPPAEPSAEAAQPDSTRTQRSGGPVFPAEVLAVSAWPDPVLDRLGHDPRSTYVERYWLPILGPSCLLLLRRLAAELEQQPDGFDLVTADWAGQLGVGMKGGRNGPLWRAVERGCRFGAAQRNGERLAVRRRLPPLTSRQVERLPHGLQLHHREWVQIQAAKPRRPAVTKWSERRLPSPPPVPVRPAPASAGDASSTQEAA